MKKCFKILALAVVLVFVEKSQAQENIVPMDVFDLKHVTNVEISPDGSKIAYLVNFKDIMTDKNHSNLWIMDKDGSNKQQINNGNYNDTGLSWSNKGDRLAYKSNKDGKTKIYIRHIQNGKEISISDTKESPGTLVWSPDDKKLAFEMFVPEPLEKFYELPQKPDSVQWNAPPVYIDKLPYRQDGAGYYKSGHKQLFVLNVAENGTLKQVTSNDFNHNKLGWSPDGKALISYSLIREAGYKEHKNTDIYSVALKDGKLTTLTDRFGADENPKVSNNGKWIAYTGYDGQKMSFQNDHLYVMDIDGKNPRKVKLPKDFDRGIVDFEWSSDDQGFYISYVDVGNLQLSYLDMDGKLTKLSDKLGGSWVYRPYSTTGSFSVANNGMYAFNHASAVKPPEVGVGHKGENKILTNVNEAFFKKKKVAGVEEFWVKTRHDQLPIQCWVVKPADFDPKKQYPMILQIHGGPHASYGPFFALDFQTYAAAGYVVLYINPRGSTGYGEKFTQEINHAFPSHDYDDLMTGVPHMLDQPYIDKANVFVNGESGGGLLAAWITSKSGWFRAAAVIKPVINWFTFALYADNVPRYSYWFPEHPWENPEHYLKRSPISYVDKVKAPTLLLTGEKDYRTPIAETEQHYAALKLQGVETAMVRIPNASHGIDAKGSGTVGRLTPILAWFEKYKDKTVQDFAYSEKEELPGDTREEKLKHVSQIDKLSATKNDYARCSASASLNAFLIMDGDWGKMNKKFGLSKELTFENVHKLQDTIVIVAKSDGEDGIYGSFKPKWDKKSRLAGWRTPEGVELPDVLKAFNFEYEPLFGPTKEKEYHKKGAVEAFFDENPSGAILMGVHEVMNAYKSEPIGENAPGNHYIMCYKRDGEYRFIDTWRKPGSYSNGVFTKEEVENMLFKTENMLVGLTFKQ
ncbi:MAG: S9 family peptidase [Ekhidna sp.]|nr:S9 family peptidase [Ekhidna sp.]